MTLESPKFPWAEKETEVREAKIFSPGRPAPFALVFLGPLLTTTLQPSEQNWL